MWSRQYHRTRASLRKAAISRALTKALLAPIKPGTVIWESFAGNGALCNPEALFRTLLDHPDHGNLRHTWVLTDLASETRLGREFAHHPRVSFVCHRSAEYFALLESSEYLINNATFPPEYVKRPEQTYLNTWHGTPLKKMGYDIADGAADARNVLRNFLSADYLLSQNTYMTTQMYLTGYRLGNVFNGGIIEEGYPRSDHMFGADAGEQARAILREVGIETAGKKVLIYAPTWRGSSFYAPTADLARLRETFKALEESAALSDWVVLLKAHQAVADQVADDPDFAGRVVPNDVPANQALAIADILVSDFSSIFVDYLATGRPVVFHIPDVASYSEQRGLYLTPGELPGPVSTTPEGLTRTVDALVREGLEASFPTEHARYRELAAAFTPKDDGGASLRVIDIVFGGNEDGYQVRRGFRDGRKTLLLYVGGLITNGITSSMLNLLEALDPKDVDVTVLFYRSSDPDRLANAARLPSHVRQVIRDGGHLQYALLGSMHDLSLLESGDERTKTQHARLWEHEWRRIFGAAEFDSVIDFSGYAAYWSRILAHGTGKRKTVWLHNDLAADAQRTVEGTQPHLVNLGNVFKLYRSFDALASVSPDLQAINSRKLKAYASQEAFVSVRNAIDARGVLRKAGRRSPTGESARTIDPGDLPSAIAALNEIYSTDAVLAEAQLSRLPGATDATRGKTFVTVGRLSPEKNHERLLRAFALVAREDEQARLIIIGDGPLLTSLRELAASLGVTEAVTFTGRLSNPYSTMARADCFVMSSDYEGQPIVILEARVLGLPIVTTRFGSAASAMEGSGGLIVDTEVDALAEGLRAFLRGEVTSAPFDHEAYNREVVAEFLAVALPPGA